MTHDTNVPGVSGEEKAKVMVVGQTLCRGSRQAFVTARPPRWTPRRRQAPTSRGGVLLSFYNNVIDSVSLIQDAALVTSTRDLISDSGAG